MYKIKQNRLLIVATLLATTTQSLLTSAPFIQSAPRVSRNEYNIQFPQHPIKVKLEAGDLKYLSETNPTITIKIEADDLKHLTKINPKVTFDVNFSVKWETLWTLAGAIGSAITIKNCQSTDDPYKIATQAAMSATLFLLPHLYNYMTQTKPPELFNEKQE